MSNDIDIKPGMLDLKNPDELACLFDDYLDYTLDFIEKSENADDFSEKISDHALLLTMGFTMRTPMLGLDDELFGEKLGYRLKDSLCKDGLLAPDSPVLLSTKASDFIFVAAVLMAQQFMEVIKDCSMNDSSSEVVELRRKALVRNWVDRFLGKGKYARR